MPGFDSARPWTLHPQVSLRPEPFGALLYHFGTRRLSFLKDPTLSAAVRALAGAPSARQACRDAGVAEDGLPRYERALASLATRGMLVPR
ncbi:MAG TPA: mycofactocin biosynthesis chaperone MftB [Rugosimonospora sp.]|nr:mycofactocin biosynthesis chaperone MftB [Rugosimonospora sp.]